MKDAGDNGKTLLFNRLGLLRSERGLTRQQLAEAVGVHYQTIGYLERGEYSPSLVLALKLCRVFALPVEAVFSLEPLPPLSEQLYGTNTKEFT